MKTKRILGLLLWLLLISTVAFAVDGEFKPGSEPDGFRGIKWGTDISTLSDMEYVTTNPGSGYGEIQIYKKKNDELTIGGATLNRIEYAFWRRKVCGVVIYADGSVAQARLKEAIFAKFGKGFYEGNKNDLPLNNTEGYYWYGETTTMMLGYNEFSKAVIYTLLSTETLNQQTEYGKQKAKEGGKVNAQESNAGSTTRKQLQNLYSTFLAEKGYEPQVDKDGNVQFKYKDFIYFIRVVESDPQYFEVFLPNIWKVSTDDRTKALEVANELTATTKVSKIVVLFDNTWLSAELFLKSPEDFKDVFQMAVSAIDTSKNKFIEKMRQ